jgi:hypothetical protein
MNRVKERVKRLKERAKRLYWNISTVQVDGIGIIEIILILVIIIGLVLIFRTQISAILSKSFKFITDDSKEINSALPTPKLP